MTSNSFHNVSTAVYIAFVILFVALLLSSVDAYADEVQIGRYTSMKPIATQQQSDVLSVVVKINFNTHITTVGEALNHLLLRSGYQLASKEASDPYMPVLLSRPLPEVHRLLGPITLSNALSTLAGPAWDLVVDPVNRLVSFDLLPEYRHAGAPGERISSNQ